GMFVVISHDHYFINRIATSIAKITSGRAELFSGDYDTFLERHLLAPARGGGTGASSQDEADPESRDQRRDAHHLKAEERNRRYRERQALENRVRPVEDEIHHLEARGKQIDALQADP